MATITPFKEIDVNQIHVSQPKRNRSGGLLANVTYGKSGGPLIFKSPKMPCPFGVSEYTDKDKDVGTKWSLSLSFRYKETNKEVAEFYDKLEEINERMIDIVHKNSMEWFAKDYTRDLITVFWRSLITPSKKAEYAPTLKLSLIDREVTSKDGTKSRELAADVFNTNKERIDPRDIAKGDSVITLIAPGTVYLAGKNAGITLKMQQAVRFPSTNVGKSCAIEISEDSISQSAPTAAPGVPTPADKDDETMDDATSPGEGQDEEGETRSEATISGLGQ